MISSAQLQSERHGGAQFAKVDIAVVVCKATGDGAYCYSRFRARERHAFGRDRYAFRQRSYYGYMHSNRYASVGPKSGTFALLMRYFCLEI